MRIALLGLALVFTSLSSWLAIAGSVIGFATRGHAAWVDGLFNALIWIANMATAFAAGRLVRRFGLAPLLLFATALRFAASACYAASDSAAVWVIASLGTGAATGLLWVLGEAVLTGAIPADRRGRIMGLIETLVGGTAMAGGAIATALATRLDWVFIAAIAAMAVSAALFVAARGIEFAGGHDAPAAESTPHDGLLLPVLVMGALGGVFEAGSTGLLPVQAVELGLGAAAAASMVAVIGVGSLLGQFPLGAASDRYGALRVALWCAAAVALTTPLIAFVPEGGGPAARAVLWGVGFLWGFAGGGLYTLGVVAAGHAYRGPALVRTMGLLVVAYTGGAALAPVLGNALAELWPGGGVAVCFAALCVPAVVMMRRARA